MQRLGLRQCVPMRAFAAGARRPRVAIAGATGAVGQDIYMCLKQRNFPLESVTMLASQRSAGKTVDFYGGDQFKIELLDEKSFDDNRFDYVFFSAGGSQSKKFAPIAADKGSVVIDNSSAFRMDPNVPLVVPEVNPHAAFSHKNLIANPNCSTIVMTVAAYPLHQFRPIKRMVISTYQAASGAGAAAMAELEQQARDWSAGKPLKTDIFGRQYLWNVFSHNSAVLPSGYNEEENKMIVETSKIFETDSIGVTATCVRVPVLRTHCESVNIEFQAGGPPMTVEKVHELIRAAPGVDIEDNREANSFPEPLKTSGKDDVMVGRVRQDTSLPAGDGIDLFLAGDQLLKGAALNAVQIAELLERGQ